MNLLFILGIKNDFIHFLERNMFSCSFKKMGVECAGCGMQRAIILLLKGEFVEAFYMYPPIYSILLMFAFLAIHLKFRIKNGHKILVALFILNLFITLANYIIKIN